MMVRAPRLARFQSPTDILNARSKNLPTDLWSYKLTSPGGSQYGLDTIFADDTPPPDEANMALWIPVADGNRRDGVGDLLEVGGIDVERHRKNPLCLFDHGKKVDLPIGLFETRDNHRYTFEIDPVTKSAGGWAYFYQGKDLMGVTQGKAYEHAVFCEQLFDMGCKRVIRGGSIGYQVKAARELQPDYERGTPKGLHLLKILMLEGSMVVLPASMDTVGKLLSDGICCGKSLSPYLVKSLEPYAPERKAMVTVPLANLQETTIPPAKWRPGKGAVKSVEGEEDKGYEQMARDRAAKPSSYAAAQQALGRGMTTPPHTIQHPMPRQPGSNRLGSGFHEVRQKYRTKGHDSARTSNVISENDPKTGAYRLITHGVPAEHQVGAAAKPQSARRSAKIGKTPAATTARVHATIHRDDVAASNAPVVGEPVGTHGPVAIYGDALPTTTSKPAAAPAERRKLPSAEYHEAMRTSKVAQPAPGTMVPSGNVRKVKELRAKYSKSVVPAHVARGAILNARHAGIQQRRAGSENAIPERDTNYRRPDEVGAGRSRIPGKRPVAPNPTGPSGGREAAVHIGEQQTKLPEGTTLHGGRRKEQPSSHVDPKKARQILKDGTVNGKPLTPSQRRMFGAAAGRGEKLLFVKPGAKKPKEAVSAGNLGVGPHKEIRKLRGKPQNEVVDPAEAENMAATQEPGKQPRVYTQNGRHFSVSGTVFEPGGSRRNRVKSLRAKYKSGKREFVGKRPDEIQGHGEIVHEHVSYGGRPTKKGPRNVNKRGEETIKRPTAADAAGVPGYAKPKPKPKAAPAAQPAKQPYVPNSDAMRQREAVIRHEQARNYPKNRHIQRAIGEADRTAGVSAEARERHRSGRRIGAVPHLTLPPGKPYAMRKSLLDETDEQRAVILELNQKVVALARQLA